VEPIECQRMNESTSSQTLVIPNSKL